MNEMPFFKSMIAVVLTTAILYIYVWIQVAEQERYIGQKVLRPRKHMYVIDNSFCKIRELDPFDVSVQKYFHLPMPKVCSGKHDLTHQRGNTLMLNLTSVKDFCPGRFAHCEYSAVIRKGDNDFKYSAAIKFTANTVVTNEFVRVKCFCTDGKRVYTNFHAFVHAVNVSKTLTKITNWSKTTTLKSQDNVLKLLNKTRLNVVMLALDSLSRLNSYRQLTLTRRFLLDILGGVELQGYNKVADNTLVNIMPMLFGKYIKEMPWTPAVRIPFDKYDLMWSKYHRQGYKTLFAEDSPGIAMFNGGKPGFAKLPTDHYFRPMSLAMEREPYVWWSGHHCMNGRLEVQLFMKYIFDFANVYKSEPHFAFTFLSRLSHDDVNLVGSADYAFEDFFRSLHKEQMLNDTLLFFFSDHGIRFGKFRETLQGKLEERLPMMYIVPPKWFPERFPKFWENLKTNSRRLTTPFDVHETLLAALNLEQFEKDFSKIDLNSRGVSLFAPVPENRTCESATILAHWCTCERGKKLPVTDSAAIKVAGLIVAHINKLLQPEKDKCFSLKLSKIQEVSVIEPNDKLLKYVGCKDQKVDTIGVNYGNATKMNSSVYQLTIRTVPGMALFETTVTYDSRSNRIEMLGDISRTNKYGSQSRCTSKLAMKKYCYCK